MISGDVRMLEDYTDAEINFCVRVLKSHIDDSFGERRRTLVVMDELKYFFPMKMCEN